MRKLIIFGGTFDPIHNGHLRIACAASLKFNADVVFVPAKSPRWKEDVTEVNHRLKMLKMALKDAPSGSSICDYEIKSPADINYSIDTVRYFKSTHPNTELYFLIGADQVNKFNDWKDAEELAKLAHIIYSARPENDLNKEIINKYSMVNIECTNSGDVSSTAIRELKSIDLPISVLSYIEDNRLYFVEKLAKFLPEARLNHSIQVARLSHRIAKVNKLSDPWRYYVAGLLHDLGKTYSTASENSIEFMNKHFPEECDLPKFSYHQFIGASLAESEFGIKEEDIIDAIKYHCTGKANMNKVGMVVYAADKIEPTRDFDSRWLINSCLSNWYKGFIDTLEDNRKYLLGHAKDIENRYTKECMDMYLGEKKHG